MKIIILLLCPVLSFGQSVPTQAMKDSAVAVMKRSLGIDSVGAALVFKTDSVAAALAAFTLQRLADSTAQVRTFVFTRQVAGNYASGVTNTGDNATNTQYSGLAASKLSIPVAGQGLGGTVTQATNKSTGVTLNKQYGRITMNGAALAAAAEVTFVLTNSFIAATDVVIVNIQSVGTASAYFVTVGAVGAGVCNITIGNASTGSLSQAIVLNYAIFKSVID